jgi:hypothetical protein
MDGEGDEGGVLLRWSWTRFSLLMRACHGKTCHAHLPRRDVHTSLPPVARCKFVAACVDAWVKGRLERYATKLSFSIVAHLSRLPSRPLARACIRVFACVPRRAMHVQPCRGEACVACPCVDVRPMHARPWLHLDLQVQPRPCIHLQVQPRPCTQQEGGGRGGTGSMG